MNIITQKIIANKWTLPILFVLSNNQQISYGLIQRTLQIPKSSLNRRLNELVKHKYLEKFVYGSKRKPHYTEYKITNLALNYINNLNTYNNY